MVKVGVTTSFQNSGLSGYIKNDLEKIVNDDIHIIAVGTGRALELAKNGDVDMIITHAPELEEEYILNGYISKKFSLYV